MSVKANYRYIVSTPDIAGGKPRIADHRITVQDIVVWHEMMGVSADEIASQYGLSLSEIYAALAYYYDHQAEVDATLEESQAFAEALRKKDPSLVAKKLHDRPG